MVDGMPEYSAHTRAGIDWALQVVGHALFIGQEARIARCQNIDGVESLPRRLHFNFLGSSSKS
jgi:hypothetical protein